MCGGLCTLPAALPINEIKARSLIYPSMGCPLLTGLTLKEEGNINDLAPGQENTMYK